MMILIYYNASMDHMFACLNVKTVNILGHFAYECIRCFSDLSLTSKFISSGFRVLILHRNISKTLSSFVVNEHHQKVFANMWYKNVIKVTNVMK